jgi:SAM-dependent MidA family methyltransferase
MSLRRKIEEEIEARGPIPFSRYMELCLYHPELGYYSQPREKFGKAGDFYTSSDVHAVFGRLLARQFEEMWRMLGSPAECTLLELGPGRGLFAQDVLSWSERTFPEFFSAVHYVLWEQSAALRAQLGGRLESFLIAGKASIPTGIDFGQVAGEALIIFANEFFDALPVEILSGGGSLRIDSHGGRFVETWAPPSLLELEFLDRYSVHPEDGERVEATLAGLAEMRGIARHQHRGYVVVIDYGYAREELLAGRHRGTLMTYRRHAACTNPYEAPGEQDITAHVNFSALAGALRENGMQAARLRTQSQFLMGIGQATQFADAFAGCRLPQEQAKVALQLKHLVTPTGMGETFQVLVASRDGEFRDLAGLRFG